MRNGDQKMNSAVNDMCLPVRSVNADAMILNRDYQDILKTSGLDSFDSVYAYPDGEVIKNIKDRSVTRIEMGGNAFYLKRHNRENIGFLRLFKAFFPRRILSQGRLEFENACIFRECGLSTAIPVAAGERFFRFFWAESFVMTSDVFPFVSLEDMLRENPDFFKGATGEIRKKILMDKLGKVALKMHRHGLNHRDFNATHILLFYENESDIPQIALFDLQRVNRRKFLRFRWIIKSLAELSYTLPEDLFDEKDRMTLFLSYKDKSSLHWWDKVQLFWIRRKVGRIRRHTEKIFEKKRNLCRH